MHAVVRLRRLVCVAAYIACACQAAISSPSMPAEDIDLLRCDTPLANVVKPPLVVYHLRILVLRPTRRLYVPHGLPAAPCPMSTSLLNSDLCTLSACYTLISSPPRPAVPPGDDVQGNEMYCLIISGLPCTSDTACECHAPRPILLNLPVCGPSLPVRSTFLLPLQWLCHM